MKNYIFKQYTDNICEHLDIDTEELFARTKKPQVVEGRQLLYFLCNIKRQMGLTEISSYAEKVGLNEDASNVRRAIEKVKEKLNDDPDYVYIIKKLEDIEL